MKPNSTLSVANNVGKSISFKSFDGAQRGVSTLGIPREFVIVENIRQVCLLDIHNSCLGVKRKAKSTPECQLRERAKLVFRELSVHSNPDFNFA